MSRTYSNQFSYDGKLKMGIWGVAKEFFILLLSLLVIHKQQHHLRYLVSGSSPYIIPITLSLLILIPTLLPPYNRAFFQGFYRPKLGRVMCMGWTALRWAAQEGHKGVEQFFLERRAVTAEAP
ncbi:hypothetical protein M430DRAFT_236829 [Amorphotheca resinae ATCC 22711]|uniref:Uncharacterized protein n=1 Tax=Amorphotheca resinae ATCC 22711 TaxID=857342 RepID=A0A2T3B4W9_AMORE|nr:hypothetical protein M430DRAFT_236829 [Amorphotheca resinae ATCC 22711]PSS20673.1 hypothetical protein M430DRAFT_236829 [Amorphotheca resinae ATCC 22711]